MGTELDSVNEFEDILCLDPSLSTHEGERQDAAPATPPAKQLEKVDPR
jgi:hypothetical protein